MVPARNEEHNIANLLTSIINLDYPKDQFEIIVVDDQSEDNTLEKINSFRGEIKRLKIVRISSEPGIVSSKKSALSKAISAAQGELILTTDADCILPPYLLSMLAAAYRSKQPQLIIAPVRIQADGTFLSLFQSLDFLALQAITLSGVHQLCNGANLSFSRKAFIEVGGYEGVDDIASGDDVLLLKKFSEHYPGKIHILKSRKAIVDTSAVHTLNEFIHQRIRWSGKWQRLHAKDKAVLMGVYILNALLTILLFSSFVVPEVAICGRLINVPLLWLVFVGLKCTFELLLMLPASRFYGLQRHMIWFPLLQPLHIIYTFTTGLFGIRGNYNWKGRKNK